MLGGGGLRSQQHHARGRGHMQLHLECTTSGAIVNYQSGGPSSAHDGGAAFLFALEQLHATFTATCHNGAIRAPTVSVANTPTCEDVGNTSGESDMLCHIAGAQCA